jgi:transposase
MFASLSEDMESSELEQRTNIKFCFKLGKTVTESHEMVLRVYGDATVSRKTVYKWFGRFRRGALSTEDEQRSSTLTTEENMSKINKMIRANKRLTIREICNALNISSGPVKLVLTKNLNMREVGAKFVSRLLSQEQK